MSKPLVNIDGFRVQGMGATKLSHSLGTALSVLIQQGSLKIVVETENGVHFTMKDDQGKIRAEVYMDQPLNQATIPGVAKTSTHRFPGKPPTDGWYSNKVLQYIPNPPQEVPRTPPGNGRVFYANSEGVVMKMEDPIFGGTSGDLLTTVKRHKDFVCNPPTGAAYAFIAIGLSNGTSPIYAVKPL